MRFWRRAVPRPFVLRRRSFVRRCLRMHVVSGLFDGRPGVADALRVPSMLDNDRRAFGDVLQLVSRDETSQYLTCRQSTSSFFITPAKSVCLLSFISCHSELSYSCNPLISASTLTHFVQSSKIKTVTKGFDARLDNRPFLFGWNIGFSRKLNSLYGSFWRCSRVRL